MKVTITTQTDSIGLVKVLLIRLLVTLIHIPISDDHVKKGGVITKSINTEKYGTIELMVEPDDDDVDVFHPRFLFED